MIQVKKPDTKLKGIEYLLLAIQSDPGKSQRHYLRRLYQYKHGRPSYNNGASNNGYFTSESYRDVLWYNDDDSRGVRYNCDMSVNGVFYRYGPGSNYAYKTKSSMMRLTLRGYRRANEVRKKLGLEPIDLTASVPSYTN